MKDTAIPTSGLANLRHAERFPWHVTSTAVPISFYLFCPTSVSILLRTFVCIHNHISDWVQTVNELPLLPNNTANEKWFHKSWPVRSVARNFNDKDVGLEVTGWIRDVVQKVLKSYLKTGNSSSPSYIQISFLIAFLPEAFIGNISINYII